MSMLVVILLVGLWGAVLLPGILRDRSSSPSSQVDAFQRSLGRLAPDAGRGAVDGATVTTPSATVQRRITALRCLGVALVSTLVLGALVGGAVWALPVLVGLALVTYLLILRDIAVRERAHRTRAAQHEQRAKVHHLPESEPEPAEESAEVPEYLERQGA